LTFGEELLEHFRHSIRMNTRANQLVNTSRVGLGFIVAAELREHRGAGHVDTGLRNAAVADAGQHTRHRDANVGALHLLHLLHGMPKHNVSDLVSDYGRELVELVGPFGDTAIDIDVSARERERVEVVRVHHVKVPVQVGARRDMRQRITEYVQVAVDDRILNDRQLCVHLLGLLSADLHFLLLRDATRRRHPCHCGHCRARNKSSHK
jgi:hypothetical protein